MARTTRPFSVTVIWWVATSTVLTWASPIRKWTVRSSAPQASPTFRLRRSLRTSTSVPGCQYAAGRQWTRAGVIHRQSPSVGGLAETVSRASTAPRSALATGRSKLTAAGMPIPTTSPSPGESVAWSTVLGAADLTASVCSNGR